MLNIILEYNAKNMMLIKIEELREFILPEEKTKGAVKKAKKKAQENQLFGSQNGVLKMQ